ncbi:MAG: ribonuclease P protein component [Gemmatimonadaceae bacterium]
MGFPRKARITRGAELQRIAREGKRIRTRYIEVRAATSPLACSETKQGVRIGLIVPRFKHSAVLRNQLKRRLRELARIQLVPMKISMDIVMRIRPDAYEATFAALTKDVEHVLEQLERWRVATEESSVSEALKVNKPHESS